MTARKLTDAQRAKVQDLYAAGGTSHSKLAKLFGVSQHTIWSTLNPGAVALKAAKERAEHPERIAERNARWYKKAGKACYLRNRVKRLANNANWHRNNPEASKRIKANWKKRNKENVQLGCAKYYANLVGAPGDGYSPEAWRVVVEEVWQSACCYCQRPFGPGRPVTLDHVVPLSRGGTNEPRNCVPACFSCNSGKRDRTLVEWRKAEHVWVLDFAAEVADVLDAIGIGKFALRVAETTREYDYPPK